MLPLALSIPAFCLFRRIGWPRLVPLNLTLSLTFRCNSRCKTCNIHRRTAGELSLEEWRNIFRRYGKRLFWATISGGEPFLREDLADILLSLCDCCRPAVITLPTNGLLTDRAVGVAAYCAPRAPSTRFVINLSIDDLEERHDAIRGVPGNYARALGTFAALRALALPNLSLGIHTVISRFNAHRVPEIYRRLQTLAPDSYVTEIAEERGELCTIGSDIAPGYREYEAAVDFLTAATSASHFNRTGRITRAFRAEYYRMVKRILKTRSQIIPCYAGFASAQIAPNGDVWMCCTKAEPIGNLCNAGYEFRRVWFSEKADLARQRIKRKECYCPLANASYTNMLHDFKSLFRVGWNYIGRR